MKLKYLILLLLFPTFLSAQKNYIDSIVYYDYGHQLGVEVYFDLTVPEGKFTISYPSFLVYNLDVIVNKAIIQDGPGNLNLYGITTGKGSFFLTVNKKHELNLKNMNYFIESNNNESIQLNTEKTKIIKTERMQPNTMFFSLNNRLFFKDGSKVINDTNFYERIKYIIEGDSTYMLEIKSYSTGANCFDCSFLSKYPNINLVANIKERLVKEYGVDASRIYRTDYITSNQIKNDTNYYAKDSVYNISRSSGPILNGVEVLLFTE